MVTVSVETLPAASVAMMSTVKVQVFEVSITPVTEFTILHEKVGVHCVS